MRQHESEPIVVQRDVSAVIIPAGIEIRLREGSVGYVTQALGGSFTVYIEGNLFRIAGEDADAIGKEPLKRPELPPDATEEDLRALVWQQLRTCFDPEIPINIVDLVLVYSCELATLSAREQEVLAGLLDNRRVSAIADALCISQHTVRNHLKAIFKKLGVRSQPQLIEACRHAGLSAHFEPDPRRAAVHA